MKRFAIALLLFILCVVVFNASAATYYQYASRVTMPSGAPANHATVTIYNSGTTTKATLYADAGGVTALANPVYTDASGYFSFYAAEASYDIKAVLAGYPTKWTYAVFVGNLGQTLSYENIIITGNSTLAALTVTGTAVIADANISNLTANTFSPATVGGYAPSETSASNVIVASNSLGQIDSAFVPPLDASKIASGNLSFSVLPAATAYYATSSGGSTTTTSYTTLVSMPVISSRATVSAGSVYLVHSSIVGTAPSVTGRVTCEIIGTGAATFTYAGSPTPIPFQSSHTSGNVIVNQIFSTIISLTSSSTLTLGVECKTSSGVATLNPVSIHAIQLR